MGPTAKIGLFAGAFVLLAVAAVTGWVRKPEPAPDIPNGASPAAAAVNPPAPAPPGVMPFGTEDRQIPYDAYGNPIYNRATPDAAPAPCGQETAYPLPTFATNSYVRTVRVDTYAVPQRQSYYPRQQYSDQYYVDHRGRRHRRSLAKSVAIVAGSAGTGAAIGGITSGGKGAGIGAIAGGAGGFTYDRLTHNR